MFSMNNVLVDSSISIAMGWTQIRPFGAYCSVPCGWVNEEEVYSDEGLDTLVRAGLNYLLEKVGMTKEYFLLSSAAFGGDKEKNALGWWLLENQYTWGKDIPLTHFVMHLAYVITSRQDRDFQRGRREEGGLRHARTGAPNVNFEYGRFVRYVDDMEAWEKAISRARR